MAEKKLIIGATETTEIIYIGSNLKAKGGKREMQGYYLGDKTSEFNYDKYGRQVHEKEIIVGKYHAKNYKQRNKNRRNLVKELIENNFQTRKCMMITLTFANVVKDHPESTSLSSKENNLFQEIYQDLEIIEDNFLKTMNDIFTPNNVIGNKEKINDLSYDSKYHDLKTCNKEFKKFIQKMNYRYENFKYVAVMDKQENGNWHYHIICNLNYIEYNELKGIWNLGGVFIGKIGSKNQLLKVTNYLKKNMVNARLYLKGQKGYLASKGLNRNIVLRSWATNEQTEFQEQAQRLEEIKKEVEYSKKRVVDHNYSSWEMRDGYSTKIDRSCTFKYYTYPIESNQYFTFTDTAIRKNGG